MIRTRGLARQFRQRGRGGTTVQAVKSVDIDVREGELVGFLGPNGAGKTTTLRMLTTLLRPTSGQAMVAGCDLLADPAGVRRRIGYVAQGGGTSPESTAIEELSIQARLYGLRRSQTRTRVARLIEQLDLKGLERRRSKALSGGQRRRLDIALGLIHAPPLLFLDEPTTGLDPQSRANLWEHVRKLRSELNMTIFITTHYLDEADALADRILIIDNGRIVAEGSPGSLKAQVSGDVVSLGVKDGSVREAARLVWLMGASKIETGKGRVDFRLPGRSTALSETMRVLQTAGIATTLRQVRPPTLDDVFFSLTGRSLRENK